MRFTRKLNALFLENKNLPKTHFNQQPAYNLSGRIDAANNVYCRNVANPLLTR